MDEFIMTRKMSDALDPSNPFEILSEALVLDFDKDVDLNYANNYVQTRQFAVLILKAVSEVTDAGAKVKLISLLEFLSDSVDDLTVVGEISQEFLSSIIAMFLANLKKCKLDKVTFYNSKAPVIEEVSSQDDDDHPLESLELIETHAEHVLQLFSGCNQLKTFCYIDKFPRGTDVELVNDFLATQDRLEKLAYKAEELAWDRLKCFQLKELTVESWFTTDGELAAAEFRKNLPNLAKLDISVTNNPSRRLMNEICGLSKLEKLAIRNSNGDEDEDEDDNLNKLVNHTVKELHIDDFNGITEKLLKIFLAVKSINLCVMIPDIHDFDESACTEALDLSEVPLETIKMIKRAGSCDEFNVRFSPIKFPKNVEQFESAVMMFAKEFSSFIMGIEIGGWSWRYNGAFRVSNSFCEELINLLPELVQLEVNNIADSGRFKSFLVENEDRWTNLEEVKIHKPFEAAETELKPKKLKIQID